MTYKIITIYFLLLTILFCQCAAPKRAMSKGDGEAIKNLVIYPIYSKIDVIEKGDQKITSEYFSSEAEIEIKKKLELYIPSRVNKQFFICEKELEEDIIKWSAQLIKTSQKALLFTKVEVPKFLLNLLDSIGANYSLFIFHRGFTRTPENLKKEYIKRRTAATASLGIYDTEPNSAYSIMIGLLIDRHGQRVSMYKELHWRNRNPNEEVVIRAQIRDLILGYFQNPR